MIKIKTTFPDADPTYATLEHPQADLGPVRGDKATIFGVIGVPEGVETVKVLRLWEQTIPLINNGEPAWLVPYRLLGQGKIIRPPIVLTAAEAAEALGVSYPRAIQLADAGRFEGAAKLGREWMIPAEAVLAHKRLGPGGREMGMR